MNKNYYLIGLLIFYLIGILIFATIFCFVAWGVHNKMENMGGNYTSRTFARVSTGDFATTTTNTLTAGTGTTTLTITSADVAREIYLYVHAKASTSAAVLDIDYLVSNNNIDWYDYNLESSSITYSQGIVQHATSTTDRIQLNSTTASTTLTIAKLPYVPSLYKKVVFTAPIGSTAMMIYSEAVYETIK